MVIDFHTHIFPDELAPRALATLQGYMPGQPVHTEGTRKALLASMAGCGVDRSVSLPVATKPSQVAVINALAAQNHEPAITAFGSLHPLMGDLPQEVERLARLGVVGVKLHPEYQDFQVDDPRWSPLYDALQQAGLIVVFHAGDDPAFPGRRRATPAGLRAVCERFPGLIMVAAHMGGNEQWDEVERDLAGAPLYFDTSAAIELLPPPRFAALVRRHGVQRVLFGSDTPWFSQATALMRVSELPLSSTEQEAILSSNARQLLAHPRRPPG